MEDNRILLSVIIPVYNAQQYLSRAIDSVKSQLKARMELILVDDGSSDGSGGICDGYAAEDSRILVIHQTNAGASAARNRGIRQARGQYISFLDADDEILPSAYEALEDILEQYHPDLVDFGWKYVTLQGDTQENHHRLPKNQLLDQQIITDTVLPVMLNLVDNPGARIFPFLWNKVFKRSIILENGIQLPENCRVWEDNPFIVQYLKYCRSYYSLDWILYTYHGTPRSLSTLYDIHFFDIIMESYASYQSWYADDYDFDTPYANEFYCRLVENMIFRSLKEKENQEVIRENILKALANEQVIYWYAHRGPQTPFEKKVTQLVVSRQGDSALEAYTGQLAQRPKRNFLRKIKTVARRLLGRS